MSLEKINTQTGDDPKIVIIWMHGLGADGHDFESVVPQFEISDFPIKFVFPHAPKIPVTINAGMVMRAWYDIKVMDIGKHADKQGVIESEKLVHELIDEQIALGFKHDQIVLAGFSQGGAMSLQVSTRLNKKIGGIIALSSYLPIPEQLLTEINTTNLKTPIFMAHGTQDPVVPFALGQTSRDALIKAGYVIDWHQYPIEHGVSVDEIMDIRQWIIKNLKT
ncbi:MAG: dienelactone hydrolase family protein [Alcanivoracaceae bacterium]|nr:dienelactone hydrolase family protein [Alcanivoracaceae bacterium]